MKGKNYRWPCGCEEIDDAFHVCGIAHDNLLSETLNDAQDWEEADKKGLKYGEF